MFSGDMTLADDHKTELEFIKSLENELNVAFGDSWPKIASILSKFQLSSSNLYSLRTSIIDEMKLGLSEEDKLSAKTNLRASSLKMLSSHISDIPNGSEQGTFYSLDWGGTNYRICKIKFEGNNKSKLSKHAFKIASDHMVLDNNNETLLFDYLALKLKQFIIEHSTDDNNNNNNNDTLNVGFCFSFPFLQSSINDGILLSWTKGYDIPNCINKNIRNFMEESWSRNNMKNIKIQSIVNDTVSNLFACGYDHKNTKIGCIIGTGFNIAYIDSSDTANNRQKIIDCECGDFGSKRENHDKTYLLPRNEIDLELDTFTNNQGSYLYEKMFSGKYIDEVIRLTCTKVFGNKVSKYGKNSVMNTPWHFTCDHRDFILTTMLRSISSDNNEIINDNYGKILIFLRDRCGLTDFTMNDAKLVALIVFTMMYRGGDLAATMLSAILQQCGLYDECNNQFQLCNEYKNDNNKYVTIGIDGSLFQNEIVFEKRLRYALRKLIGNEIYSRVSIVHNQDGSGKGAALSALLAMKTGKVQQLSKL